MHEFTCPGLPASWVNAWLAAVGATVLDPRIRLRWTVEGAPVAVLSSDELEPVEALAASWPDRAFLDNLPIARSWNDTGTLEQNVPVDHFVGRVRKARGDRFAWTLSSTMTDLALNGKKVANASFNLGVPNGVTLHERLLKVHSQAGAMNVQRLNNSLVGQAPRVRNNGLGFDITRLGSLADASDTKHPNSGRWIEPVVELLAFFGLKLLPVRAQGVEDRIGYPDKRQRGMVTESSAKTTTKGRIGDPDKRQRGWRRAPGGAESRRFVWPAWRQPLDTAGIDALLDLWNPWRKQAWDALGIHAGWRSVEYQIRRGSNEATRGIGSEIL